MEPALKAVQNILPKLEARIIEFLSEWLVTFLMSAKHVLDTRAPHLYFMFLKEYWFRELYLGLKVTASFDRSESYTRIIDGQVRCITPDFMWKSAVHRSAVRSNASTKFLQNYAGRRVRQPRTPNTSAERKFTNLIKLKQCRVKKTVSPSTPTCWRQASSFRSRRNTISHRETQTQQTRKRKRIQCSLCRSVLCQVMWHSSSCSLNELLTPVLRADVSTGKLDSRFPVNKPQVLQVKVCWNYSSCYKPTKLNFTR